MKNIVERLSALLKERKNADPSSSYVASLYAKGNEKIIEKIAEETDELIAEITEACLYSTAPPPIPISKG